MESRVKQIRNHLHNIPETGGNEIKTSAFLAGVLAKCGYEVFQNIAGHGVIGILRGNEKGRVVAVKADMDALLQTVDGKETPVHSCGHDANCAMVLAMAEEIAAFGIKKGVLKIIFQPDEESLKGGKDMVASGMFDDIEYLIGIHLRPIQEAKLGQATASLLHGAATLFRASIHGKVAHGARPHLGVNPIDAAVLLVNAVNAIHEDPNEVWSAKTTQFISNGAIVNAVPGRVDIAFDIRSASNKVMDSLVTKISKLVEDLPKSMGANGVVEYKGEVPGAEYDNEVTNILEKAVTDAMGVDALLPPITTPGGDDFHFYKKLLPHIKAGFVGIGADLSPGLHDPAMKFNDDALKDGVNVLGNAVKKLLC